ncbi:MAG: hypothetical protein JXQ87_14665 [Bacteroidia bacterium]
MFKQIILYPLTLLLATSSSFCQTMGNANINGFASNYGFNTSKTVALGDSAFMVEARVLYNANATYYSAHFALAQEGETVISCNESINRRIDGFINEIINSGIKKENCVVDFVSQTKVYKHVVEDNLAIEQLKGFVLKKNVIITFNEKEQIDELIKIASNYEIYDLAKVDHKTKDLEQIKNEMWQAAVKQINAKKSRYLALTDLTTTKSSIIVSEEFRAIQPGQLYAKYSAFESTQVVNNSYSKSRLERVDALKMSTNFYQPLAEDYFDQMINNNSLEPHLQYTFVIKVKYFVA